MRPQDEGHSQLKEISAHHELLELSKHPFASFGLVHQAATLIDSNALYAADSALL